MPNDEANATRRPTATSGAVWSESAVADYAETAPETWRRLTAAGVWQQASKQFELARSVSDELASEAAKQLWLRTHWPPPHLAKQVELPAPLPSSAFVPVVDSKPISTTETPTTAASSTATVAESSSSSGKKKKKRKAGRATDASRRPGMSPQQVAGVATLQASAGVKASDAIADAEWVYTNLAAARAKLITAADAPSVGAWGLMLYALEKPEKFYTDVFSKAGKVKQEREAVKRTRDDGRKLLDLLDRLDPSGQTAGLGLVQAGS